MYTFNTSIVFTHLLYSPLLSNSTKKVQLSHLLKIETCLISLHRGFCVYAHLLCLSIWGALGILTQMPNVYNLLAFMWFLFSFSVVYQFDICCFGETFFFFTDICLERHVVLNRDIKPLLLSVYLNKPRLTNPIWNIHGFSAVAFHQW